ncbi:MAG: hypothetical protein KGJ93_05065, partial [Patescibacteria group bacterium]|nr:hypothetical protein [Patescibacteria group bacterium]
MENQNLTPPTPQSPPAPKKWYQHKGIITIIILAILTTVSCWAYFNLGPTRIEKLANSTITGTVLSNYQGCAHDDGCVLMIQTSAGKKISAVYGSGLTPQGACYLNSGFELKAGDQVELHGVYTDQNTFS